ncbi:MAG TPA: hypothetical protein VHN11_19225 [Xanthobacteraceae bacterium]|jgi:hypothetical protein|nr:hypothetical protein [Xanthobacteraceae bacterium]
MTESNENFWDELGLRWGAIDPDIGIITPRLAARLRRQSQWLNIGMVGAGLTSAAGLLLGIATIWLGWKASTWHFVIRGLGITAVSTITAGSVWMLLSVRSSERASTLAELLELAILRSVRMTLLVRMGVWACGIAAVAGLVGTAVRTHLSGPPRMSPILDLILIGMVATVLYLCGRQCDATLASYTRLKYSLFGNAGGK